MPDRDESQEADFVQAAEDEILDRVKDVSRRIQERVKDALKDTTEVPALSDSTDEQKPLPDESPKD
jgi:hypothetical protein